MSCYIERILSESDVKSDIKLLIPDAGMRRRMGRVLRMSVSTAVECAGGIDRIMELDSIITSTGFGCLTDSEKFLRNVINDNEQLLNPTPFIQSTFNTIGGQIALLGHNHCYNVTYVNKSHGFEDALLDAFLRMDDGESKSALVGCYDESTQSLHIIMERLGLLRGMGGSDGCTFVKLTSKQHSGCIAEICGIHFPTDDLTEDDCRNIYSSSPLSVVLYNSFEEYGLYPTVSGKVIQKGVGQIKAGIPEVIIYNKYLGGLPSVLVIRKCI